MEKKFKKICIEFLLWIGALIISILIINFFCLFYKKPVGKLNRDYGATFKIRKPHSLYLSGSEGYGFYRVDKNGFLNDNLPLANDYYIILGSSHSQGIEVMKGKRYSDLLNKYFSYDPKQIVFYNMAQEAHGFLMIAQGISALEEEFNPKAILIEIYDTEFEPASIKKALNKRHYNPDYSADTMFQNLKWHKKIGITLKEAFPLFSVINLNLFISSKNQKNKKPEKIINLKEYQENLSVLINQIRSIYRGKMIIIYHPAISIEKNGNIKIQNKPTDEIFEKICEENNIIFINTTNEIKSVYISEHKLPYGFHNTAMGSGHLNETGHRIIADVIYRTLKEDF